MFKQIKNNYCVRNIYRQVPYPLKKGGLQYWRFSRWINRVHSEGAVAILSEQRRLFLQTVRWARENTSGYSDKWKNVKGSSLSEILENAPTIEKSELQERLNDFTVLSNPKKRLIMTGGSTGRPLGFYEDPSMWFVEAAFVHWHWNRELRKPIRYSEPMTVLRGERMDSAWRFDPMGGLYLSTYLLNDHYLDEILSAIHRFPTRIFHAFPSSAYLLAKLIKDHRKSFRHRFERIMLGSEAVLSFQRHLIEEVFEAPICTWYGHSERAAYARHCITCGQWHFAPLYGYVEVIRADGTPARKGEVGEIVATGFWNRVTPFIRYRTGDYAELGGIEQSCPDGLGTLTAPRLEGRRQEFAVGRSGTLISMSAMNIHDDVLDGVRLFRFVQKKLGQVIFTYVPMGNGKKIDEGRIYRDLTSKLGDDFELTLQSVPEIARTQGGKISFLEQQLDISPFLGTRL